MDDERNLIHLGVGLIMIAVASLHLPLWLSVAFAIAGAWFIAWNLFGPRWRSLLLGGEWGSCVVRAMDGLADLTAAHDEFHSKRKEIVERAWRTLTTHEKDFLRRILLHGQVSSAAMQPADTLKRKNLIVGGEYGLPATIAPGFRKFIADKLRDDQATPKSP